VHLLFEVNQKPDLICLATPESKFQSNALTENLYP
jgi:hypothetical protein